MRYSAGPIRAETLLLQQRQKGFLLLGNCIQSLIASLPTINQCPVKGEFCRRIGWLKPDSGLKNMDGRGEDADRPPHQLELLKEKGASRWIFGPHRDTDLNRRFTLKSLST